MVEAEFSIESSELITAPKSAANMMPPAIIVATTASTGVARLSPVSAVSPVSLAAGAVGSPDLLLRSGIANSSGLVGENLHLHPQVMLAGVFEEPFHPYRGIPQSYYVDEYIDLSTDKQTARAHVADVLLDLLDEYPGKFLVFTEFRRSQDDLLKALDESGISATAFHGGLSGLDKERAVRAFRGDTRVLVSTECGGEGRNFEFCHRLVLFDMPWSPATVEQRIGRLDRIGFQGRSKSTSRWQNSKLRPSPPHSVEISRDGPSGWRKRPGICGCGEGCATGCTTGAGTGAVAAGAPSPSRTAIVGDRRPAVHGPGNVRCHADQFCGPGPAQQCQSRLRHSRWQPHQYRYPPAAPAH